MVEFYDDGGYDSYEGGDGEDYGYYGEGDAGDVGDYSPDYDWGGEGEDEWDYEGYSEGSEGWAPTYDFGNPYRDLPQIPYGSDGGDDMPRFVSDGMPRFMGGGYASDLSKPFGMSGGGGGYKPNTPEETGTAKIAARTAQANLDEQIRQYNTEQNARRTSAIQGGEGLVNLVNEYNRSYAQARYDYEQRYNQMLGIADSTTSQQQADVRAQYAGQRSTGMQKLQRLGMANTSLTSSMQQGLQRGESDALNRLADTMQQTKLGIIGSKKTTQELAPSRDMILAALAQAQGASGSYGGQLTKALGALDQGLSPLPYDPNAGTQIGPALTNEGITKAVNLSIGSNW